MAGELATNKIHVEKRNVSNASHGSAISTSRLNSFNVLKPRTFTQAKTQKDLEAPRFCPILSNFILNLFIAMHCAFCLGVMLQLLTVFHNHYFWRGPARVYDRRGKQNQNLVQELLFENLPVDKHFCLRYQYYSWENLLPRRKSTHIRWTHSKYREVSWKKLYTVLWGCVPKKAVRFGSLSA